jgi:L-threonylcarbamoyladenylate synthase
MLGREIPRLAMQLAERFWPGPLTLVVPTGLGKGSACSAARAGLDCVGVRMPSHPVALALLRACGVPLAAPSANLSGRPSPTTAAHVTADLSGRIAGIVDGGAAEGVGLESTVVECSDGSEGQPGFVTILRPGGVTREMLEEVAGKGRVKLDPALIQATSPSSETPVQALPKQSSKRGTTAAERLDVSQLIGSPSSASAAASASPSPSPVPSAALPGSSPAPKAPGMKYTHYAPRAPLMLCDGSIHLLLRTAAGYLAKGDAVGLLVTEENRAVIAEWRAQNGYGPDRLHVVFVGSQADLSSVARGLYAALRAFDDTVVQVIVSESFPAHGGLGEAVMNRLQKAAGGRVVREDGSSPAAARTGS